ncbi:hypothetical protein HPB49_024020 [Dermacentor silvarum]|uniref:Uncharacterized protein n=1 Tax=Dermacentor silvarum TaxID=543639 RepID=A0ACB8E3E7_DERSI|nr:hypothetical protein HPB49_024020 [Dermacentor silvarum]
MQLALKNDKHDIHVPPGNDVGRRAAPSDLCSAVSAVQSDAFTTEQYRSKNLLSILATLPVLASTPERTFSALRRLKSYLRNRINQDRFTGLALLIEKFQ